MIVPYYFLTMAWAWFHEFPLSQVALVDSEEEVNEDEGWEFVPLSDQQKFGVKTAGLEDKNTACQMLVCYARELKEGFVDYTEQVVRIMVPLLKFYFHDLIRSAAAESLPFLLESVQHKVTVLAYFVVLEMMYNL